MESEHSENQHQSNPISEPDEKKIYKRRTAGKLKTVTVLSIDGGGTHSWLEKYLQVHDKYENLRISDYFDVLSGSGMGSIIAGLLTMSDDHHNKF